MNKTKATHKQIHILFKIIIFMLENKDLLIKDENVVV